jgi:hypothetical protein
MARPMYSPMGIGVIPPHLVPEHLVSVEQHRLQLVRAVEHASNLLSMLSELFEHVFELLNMRPSY